MIKITKFLGLSLVALSLASCGVPKEKFDALQAEANKTRKDLADANTKLSDAQQQNAVLTAKLNALNEKMGALQTTNDVLMDNMGNLTALTKKGAENLEKSLESLREKDVTIRSLQEAMNKKDSIAFAVISSVKSSLGNIDDEDIEVNIEKGVVYISIADNMLFSSGSYKVNSKAKTILSKVATIVNDKSDFEFIVEGHTDNVPISTSTVKDNWDLSTLRATAIVRELQNKYNVEPSRMSASGRSQYDPIADNSTSAGRSRNRRIKIILIPKLDQFYGMVEEALKPQE